MKHIIEYDFLKGVAIMLVIMIHLVYLSQTYPRFQQFLLLFSTPVFFILSGCLAHVDRPWKTVGHKILWLAIPYGIMEGGYILMASILPVREHIDHLDMEGFVRHLTISPLGPYWYLQTLIVCYVMYYIIQWGWNHRRSFLLWLLGSSVLLLLVVGVGHIIAFYSLFYFAAGIALGKTRRLLSFFAPSKWHIGISGLALALYLWADISFGFGLSILLTYFMTCLLLGICGILPGTLRRLVAFIGRNTLSILLFSPLFTLLSKQWVPCFAFDPTVMAFTFVSVAFTVCGSLALAWIMDRLNVSRFFCGKDEFLCR